MEQIESAVGIYLQVKENLYHFLTKKNVSIKNEVVRNLLIYLDSVESIQMENVLHR